jgi:hypothetical protein
MSSIEGFPMNSQLVFFVYVVTSLISASVIAKLYVWPKLKNLRVEQSLEALIAPQALIRLIGLGFLIPGVVGPSLSPGFAVPAAGGDYATAVLALFAMMALHSRSNLGKPSAWIFNLAGAVDLINAFVQAGRHHVSPTYFGAAFFIPTAVVPPLLVAHWLVFRLLLRRESTS